MAKKRGKPTKKCVACGRAIDARALTCRCGADQPRPQENDRPEEQPAPADPSPAPTTVAAVAPEPPPKPKRVPRPATPKKNALSAFIDAIEALGGLDAAREALDLLERAKRL